MAALRERLRRALAATSPDMARLAALDAVMERVLADRERGLLAAVPGAMRQHFDRLRDEASTIDPSPGEASVAPGGPLPAEGWWHAFLRDVRDLMLSELDLRLQPVEGLLAALEAARAQGPTPPPGNTRPAGATSAAAPRAIRPNPNQKTTPLP